MLPVGSPVHVRKLKPDGALDFAWSGVVLRAEFNVDLVERGWATFRRGDVFVEFYYFDPLSPGGNAGPSGAADDARPDNLPTRFYNVFQISSADGTLKGWYCNLGLPAQLDTESRELSYVDLALDLWANPDGTFVVLDEDELDVLLDQHPELVSAAQRGRADLIDMARSDRFPRWPESHA